MNLSLTLTLTDIATLILAFATTVSLIYIGRQVRVTRQQTKGEFLLALDAQFEKTLDITRRLVMEKDFKPVGDEWPQVWQLMSVFERINIMMEDNILDVDIIDRLHGFRLLILIANDAVYERLKQTGAEWQDFIDLCYAVADNRARKGAQGNDSAFIERVHKLSKETRSLKNPFDFGTTQ
jgi:hypothetical protein